MRFTLEQRYLTDPRGVPVAAQGSVSFHTFDAPDAMNAVRLFISTRGGEVIGNVLQFPGFQAVATVRGPEGVFTLQVSPSSQNVVR